jgi:hypothetical protein
VRALAWVALGDRVEDAVDALDGLVVQLDP